MSNEPNPLDKEQIPGKTVDPLPLRGDQIPIPPPQLPKPIPLSIQPTETAGELSAQKRRSWINFAWEFTQAFITIEITTAVIYCEINNIDSSVLTNAFFLIVTMYFVRTNHVKAGGVFETERSRV